MARYIAQRLIAMAITLFLIISISFFIIHSMPGSIVDDPMPKYYSVTDRE